MNDLCHPPGWKGGRIGFNPELHRMLRERKPPLTMSMLPKKLGVSRSHLSQVLNGRLGGRDTWPLLAKFLTHLEYTCAHDFATKQIEAQNTPSTERSLGSKPA